MERGHLDGFKTSWMISRAAIELDEAALGKSRVYNSVEYLKNIIKEHYDSSKSKNYLSYGNYNKDSESELIQALLFDVIPKTFNITKENCKKYEFKDYLAGLELVLEQFNNLEHASSKRLSFLRDFIVDLGDKRLSRLDGSSSLKRYQYFAA